MSHGPIAPAGAAMDRATAARVAETLQALAAPSRVQILGLLTTGPATVGALADALGLEQSAVSHHLRTLRERGLVLGVRDGRHVAYHLFDEHVAALLSEAIGHVAHIRAADTQS